jgi:NADH-quinone oxidoreductase subunit L
MATFEVPWGFQLDPLSAVMILVVTGVGFLIHIYSTGYMWDDSGYYRFFAYLNLFMFAMLTLVLPTTPDGCLSAGKVLGTLQNTFQ